MPNCECQSLCDSDSVSSFIWILMITFYFVCTIVCVSTFQDKVSIFSTLVL